MSQPAISKHLRVLERAGLVSQAPGGRLGPRRLELAPLVKPAGWMDAYARTWRARLKAFGRRRGRGGPEGSSGPGEAPGKRP